MPQGDFSTRLFFQAHPDPILIYAHDSLRILEVNGAACEHYGWTRAEFLNLTIAQLRPEADAPAILSNVALGGAAAPMGVWLHRSKSGQTFPVEIRSESILWHDRAAELVVARALVAQTMQGTALGASLAGEGSEPAVDARERAERILGIGFWTLDAETEALTWSTPVHAIYGLPQHAPPRDLSAYLEQLHPDDRERTRDGFRRFLQRRDPVLRFEHRIRWPGGRVAHVRGAGVWESGDAARLSGVVEDITELRIAEDRERQAVDLLRIAGDVARIGGWRVDLSEKVIEWSEATAQIHDLPGQRFMPLADGLDHYPPDHRARIERAFDRCATEGAAFDELVQMLSATGRHVWVRASGEAVRDDTGRIVRVQGALQDVSELIAARAKAESLAEQLQATIDAMREAFLLIAPDGRIVYANAQARALADPAASDLSGLPMGEALPAELAAALAPYLIQMPQERVQIDLDQKRPEGTSRLRLRLHAAPGGLAAMLEDVTAEYRNQAALAESEERFRLFAEATREGVWDLDLVAGRRWWNERMVELLGQSPPEKGTVLEAFTGAVHPEDRARVRLSVISALGSGAADWGETYRVLRPDGVVVPVAERAVILRDAKGNAVRLIGSLSDQSERHALEAHMREAQRLETMGQLTGGLAHEFNNLLTRIAGNADILRERLAEHPELDALAADSVDAAERAAEITAHLLAAARRQHLKPRHLDLRDALIELAPILQAILPESIAVQITAGARPMPAVLDPIELENAILNLVLNARDAMPDGGRLEISLAAEGEHPPGNGAAPSGERIALQVRDTGTGMTEDIAARIFEPFFSARADGRGAGLGLSAVDGFMHRSGGNLRVETKPGKGTAMTMVFPRAAANAAPNAKDGDPSARAARSVHVLLVEDEPAVRAQVAEQLRALGHRVSLASDGTVALSILHEDPGIALLFTDVLLPGGMHGGELAKQARALRPDLRILFTSGFSADALIEDGRLPRDVHLLAKPFRRADLLRMLDRALGGEGG